VEDLVGDKITVLKWIFGKQTERMGGRRNWLRIMSTDGLWY
jgi:hypothetical protein